MRAGIGAKTPHSFTGHNPVHEAFLVQPFQHAIDRNTVQSLFAPNALFELMMRNRSPLRQQGRKDTNSAGCGSLSAAADHLFRLLMHFRHKW